MSTLAFDLVVLADEGRVVSFLRAAREPATVDPTTALPLLLPEPRRNVMYVVAPDVAAAAHDAGRCVDDLVIPGPELASGSQTVHCRSLRPFG